MFWSGLLIILLTPYVLVQLNVIRLPYKCDANYRASDVRNCVTFYDKAFWESDQPVQFRHGNGKYGPTMYPIFVADFADDKVLVGASHNVFVGKVVEQYGAKERGLGPETQFKVEVVKNIKGDLSEFVIVNQEGGYKDGILHSVSADHGVSSKEGYMLNPGSTYLFATRYNSTENWHTLISFPTARKLLSTNADESIEALKVIAGADDRVRQLEGAYPSEVLLKADVINGKTLNSYGTPAARQSGKVEISEKETIESASEASPNSVDSETAIDSE